MLLKLLQVGSQQGELCLPQLAACLLGRVVGFEAHHSHAGLPRFNCSVFDDDILSQLLDVVVAGLVGALAHYIVVLLHAATDLVRQLVLVQ